MKNLFLLWFFLIPIILPAQNVVEAFVTNCGSDKDKMDSIYQICEDNGYVCLFGHNHVSDLLSNAGVMWRMSDLDADITSAYINGIRVNNPLKPEDYDTVLQSIGTPTNQMNIWCEYINDTLNVHYQVTFPDLMIGVITENLPENPSTVRYYFPDPSGEAIQETGLFSFEWNPKWVLDSCYITLFTYNATEVFSGTFHGYIPHLIRASSIESIYKDIPVIYSDGEYLNVIHSGSITIYDMSGRALFKSSNTLKIILPHGLYVVNNRIINH
uniref:Uncharacterized protein n=1 Tax=viral metagenome TaxID=1070528 RepID=A0A6M3J4Z9_9ZZZZ